MDSATLALLERILAGGFPLFVLLVLFLGWYGVWMWTTVHEALIREKNAQIEEKNKEIERQRQEIKLWRDLAWDLRGTAAKAAATTDQAVSLASRMVDQAGQ